MGWSGVTGYIIPSLLLIFSIFMIAFNLIKKNKDFGMWYIYFALLLLFQIISLPIYAKYSKKDKDAGNTGAAMWLSLWALFIPVVYVFGSIILLSA